MDPNPTGDMLGEKLSSFFIFPKLPNRSDVSSLTAFAAAAEVAPTFVLLLPTPPELLFPLTFSSAEFPDVLACFGLAVKDWTDCHNYRLHYNPFKYL